MRVAVVLPRGSTYGRQHPTSIETVVRTLSAHSRTRDRLVVVCDAGPDVPAAPAVVTVPGGLGRGARVKAVAELLSGLKPDLVEHHQQLGAASSLARLLPDVPHLFYRHTRIEPGRHFIDAWRRERRLAAFDQLVFVSGWARFEFARDFPRLAHRATAVSNPIDVAAWRGDPAAREKLILFSGRAMPEKGLDLFCTALADTLDRYPDWRGALMLGDWERHRAWAGPVIQGLRRFGDRVEIHRSAPLSHVMDVTRRAAIAVTPSRVREALGLSALEAHAAGAALISSGRGGLREASGNHAFYVEPTDAAGFAAAMAYFIEHPFHRIRMAGEGQDHVGRRHSSLARARDLDDLRAAVARRPAGVSPTASPFLPYRVRAAR